MAISLLVLCIVFIVGSIIFPNKVRTEAVSQSQSADWSFAGLSYIVEPQSQIVAHGTSLIELKCKGRSITYNNDGIMYTTTELTTPHSTNNDWSEYTNTEDIYESINNNTDGIRPAYNSAHSSLNIKDRTDTKPRYQKTNTPDMRHRENKRKYFATKKLDSKRYSRTRKSQYAMSEQIVYTWYRNGSVVDTEIEQNMELKKDGSLIVRDVGENDFGEYRCMISQRNVGAIISRAAVLHKSVLNRPIVASSKLRVYTGASVLLSCQAHSIPAANLTWEKDGVPITLNNRILQLPTGSLIINNSTLANSGHYRCIAENHILDKILHSPNITLTVISGSDTNFLSKTEITDGTSLISHNLTLEEGDNIDLPCALAVSEIFWTFIPLKGSPTLLNNSPILKVTNVTTNQSGQYICSSSNVKYRQRFSLQVNTRPYFTTEPMHSLTLFPKTVRFNCSAEGIPEPKITWYKNGVPLYINGRIKIRANTLLITNTEQADAGIYQCMASNAVKEISVTAILQFKNDKIHPALKHVRCRPLNSSTILVEWEESKEDIFTLHMFKSSGGPEIEMFPQKNNSFKVLDLEPFVTYNFYVKRFHLNPSLKNLTPSDPSKHVQCSPQGLNAIAHLEKSNDTIIINWSVPKSKRGILTYLIQWRSNDRPNIISEMILNGNTTQFQIQNITDISTFEVRVLGSLNSSFVKQNLDEIAWTGLTWKRNNNLSLSENGNEYFVLPPNAFHAQKLTENSVNISWISEDENVMFNVCYSAVNTIVNDSHSFPDYCINRYHN